GPTFLPTLPPKSLGPTPPWPSKTQNSIDLNFRRQALFSSDLSKTVPVIVPSFVPIPDKIDKHLILELNF
ncbi:MAG: hypothetical protein JXR29_00230, partial [Methylothermaceae bacterium]|nr:hypothetical protein [Methylothermaceae bacterium]